MKKIVALGLALALCLSLAACGSKEKEESGANGGETKNITVKVAASPTPHAEILSVAKDILKEEGITLEIIEFTDYIQPNMATESGEVDANFFQHIAYLDKFNEDEGTHLVNVAGIHYEPYGLYAGKTARVEELSEGAKIAVPNDPSNEVRALRLLEEQGLITLNDDVDLEATKLDIKENKLKLDIVEMEAAQIPGTLSSVDMAVINGNYAIDAGLSVEEDAVAKEDPKSENVAKYTNVLVVKEGNKNDSGIQALVKALRSEKVYKFIQEQYKGAVVPLTEESK